MAARRLDLSRYDCCWWNCLRSLRLPGKDGLGQESKCAQHHTEGDPQLGCQLDADYEQQLVTE